MAKSNTIRRIPDNLLEKIHCSDPRNIDKRMAAVYRMYFKNKGAAAVAAYTNEEVLRACVRFHFAGDRGLEQFNRHRNRKRAERRQALKRQKQPAPVQLTLFE